MLVYVAGLVCVVLSLRARGRRGGRPRRVLLAAARLDHRHGAAGARRENLITLFVGIELLSIPLYVLCATELRRRASLESGLKYLVIGSVGSATLLYGLALIYGATGAMQFDGIAAAIGERPDRVTDPLLLTGIALIAPGSPSRRRWRPSTSGRPTSTRAPPRRSPRSWRWRPRRPRSRSSCGCSTTRSGWRSSSGARRWPRWPRSRS